MLFAVHDLLKDPPFSHVDLLSCRNVLVYLDTELQQQLCNTFHYAINSKGYLFLGPAETADHSSGLFRIVDRPARIYQSTAGPGEKPRYLPRVLEPFRFREPEVTHYGHGINPTTALKEAESHRRAIEQVSPPSVLVNQTHRVMHLSDSAGRYFLPSGGPLSGDVVDLVRPELRFELRSALHRAFEQGHSTLTLPALVHFNGQPHPVQMHVKPVTKSDEQRDALVLFIEGEALGELAHGTQQAADETVRRLRQELELTQARMRTLREESDAVNEELRASNEELQSINEEYRSASEELETSKEELQSMNEELQTVNSELKLKLEAVSRANGDLQNLMMGLDFGMIILDSSLQIKRFTTRATDLFSITPVDEGRPITDFTHQLEYDDLIKDARAVIEDLTPIHREIHGRNNRWYDMRLRPYRTTDRKIDGVMITFADITAYRLPKSREPSDG
jgi:two-component system CheB/CheR fusion protein